MTRVIVLCGGEAVRWNNHLGCAKQLVPIDGRPLLDDTLVKLRDAGFSDLHIIGSDPAHRRPGVNYVDVAEQPPAERGNKFLSSRSLWNEAGTTLFIMGDAFLSPTAIASLRHLPAGHIGFTGRMTPSRITGNRFREIFALCFDAGFNDHAMRVLSENEQNPDYARTSTGWAFYETVTSLAARAELPDDRGVIFQHVDDFSEDFDFPHDYDAWVQARADKVVLPYSARRMARSWKPKRRKWQRRVWFAGLGGFALGAVAAQAMAAMV